jgi:DNA invertase Pin-like site-specific DNA recombinase
VATAIYARQSVDVKESESIKIQVDLCKKVAGVTDSQLRIYSDKGYSGKNLDRPEFKRMMEDVKAGKIQRVICYRLDRLSRSIVDFGEMWRVLEDNGVNFLSVNERFDTETPMGRAMIYIILVFAQLERETIAERVRDNYYERIKSGAWPGGPAPYGFSNSRIMVDGRKVPTLEPNENMDIVKRIFREYLQEEASLGGIAKKLTMEGIPAPKRAGWDNVTLSRILHSPVYVAADLQVYSYFKDRGLKTFNHPIEDFTGDFSAHLVYKGDSHGKNKYAHIPECVLSLTNFKGVICSDDWIEVQEKLSRNVQFKNKGRGKYTWLVGLLKCKECQYAVGVKRSPSTTAQPIYSLSCSGHTNLHICDISHFNLKPSQIEAVVQEELEKLLEKCDAGDDGTVMDYQDAKTKMEVMKIDEKIERLVMRLAEASDVATEYIDEQIKKLDAQKRELESKLSKSQKRQTRKYQNIVFAELDYAQKNILASTFIEKILVGVDDIEIVWKV